MVFSTLLLTEISGSLTADIGKASSEHLENKKSGLGDKIGIGDTSSKTKSKGFKKLLENLQPYCNIY